MKNIKRLLIILIVAIIIVIISMIVISTMQNKEQDNIVTLDTNTNQAVDKDLPDVKVDRVTAEDVEILTNRDKFFSIEKMMNRYFLYLRAGNARSSIFYVG